MIHLRVEHLPMRRLAQSQLFMDLRGGVLGAVQLPGRLGINCLSFRGIFLQAKNYPVGRGAVNDNHGNIRSNALPTKIEV